MLAFIGQKAVLNLTLARKYIIEKGHHLKYTFAGLLSEN